MPLTHMIVRILVVSFFLNGLFGCSSSDDPEPEAAEIATTASALIDAPEDDLFYLAKKLYSSGHYRVSSQHFNSLKDAYPLGPYTEFAEIKLADTEFFLKEYETAAAAYENALKSRPTSPAVPYLIFQAARSNQLINTDVGRDLAPLEKAVELYAKLIQDHSDSMYAETARYYRDQTFAQIAHHERSVADFYLKQGKEKAYQARQEQFSEKWAKYFSDDEEYLTTLWEEERPSARPSSSKEPVRVARLRTEPLPQITDVGAPAQLDDETVPVRVREVQCSKRNGERVTVFFNRTPERTRSQAQALQTGNGVISLPLPVVLESEMQIDCFGDQDLTISADGLLRLQSHQAAEVIDLSNPPRVVLFVK